MSQKSNIARRCQVACGGLILSLTLVGCGGSHSSSSAVSTPVSDSPAVIAQVNSGDGSHPGFTINLLPSGAATYTQLQPVPPPGTSGIVNGPVETGTVPVALTNQFFQDLSAAAPIQNLPIYHGATSVLSSSVTVEYQGEKGPINNPSDSREVALETDAMAIEKALGIPNL